MYRPQNTYLQFASDLQRKTICFWSKQTDSNFIDKFRPTDYYSEIFERWFRYVLLVLYNAVRLDSLVNCSKCDFSKKSPAKLESTCKIAWSFVIRLDFAHFLNMIGEPGKSQRECIAMYSLRYDGQNSFKHPQKKVIKNLPYKKCQSQTTSKNCVQNALLIRFRWNETKN